MVRRVVPDLTTDHLEATRDLYRDVFGFHVGMDMGWAVTLVSSDNTTAQLSLFRPSDDVHPSITIEVTDVDVAHEQAARSGAEIVHPLTDEPWGVRRFFLRDPAGTVVNVMSHPA